MFFPVDPGLDETNQIIHEGVRYEFRAFSDRATGLGVVWAAFVETVTDRVGVTPAVNLRGYDDGYDQGYG